MQAFQHLQRQKGSKCDIYPWQPNVLLNAERQTYKQIKKQGPLWHPHDVKVQKPQ